MRIEVDAKLILTIPQPKGCKDKPGEVVLAAEQFVNKLQGFNMSTTGAAVGVRIHVGALIKITQ